MNITMNVKSLKVTHLVPVSLSRFESTTVGNGVDVSDESENLFSKDLTVRILLDGLSVDMDACDGRESIVIVCGYESSSVCGCDSSAQHGAYPKIRPHLHETAKYMIKSIRNQKVWIQVESIKKSHFLHPIQSASFIRKRLETC